MTAAQLDARVARERTKLVRAHALRCRMVEAMHRALIDHALSLPGMPFTRTTIVEVLVACNGDTERFRRCYHAWKASYGPIDLAEVAELNASFTAYAAKDWDA